MHYNVSKDSVFCYLFQARARLLLYVSKNDQLIGVTVQRYVGNVDEGWVAEQEKEHFFFNTLYISNQANTSALVRDHFHDQFCT